MIGEFIGSYRITAKLGEGGMGAVYLGEHQRIARKVAIKVLLPQLSANKQVLRRFFNEARATSLIKHPGIVEISDCDVLPNGNAYIIMELLEGESLGSFLRRGKRMTPGRAAFLTRHIADALAAAHEKRIVHRDLKPDNIFLLPAWERAPAQPIKILDFGIAKLMHTDAGEGTSTGMILGTPLYMSPEQCQDSGAIDHRTDIYALGCVLFEMLCGRPPFTHEGFGELVQAHVSTVPPPLRSGDRVFSSALEGLVARMLAKSVADRPQTMRALVAELDVVTAARPRVAAAGGAAEIANAQTTSRPALAEKKIPVVSTDELMAAVRHRRTRAILLAVVTVALASGIAVWRLRDHGGPIAKSPGKRVSSPQPPRPSLPSGPPTLAVTPARPPPPPASAPTPVPAPPTAPPVPSMPAATPSPAPAARTVRVVISSVPADADVCLAADRRLLGRTRFEWRTDKSKRAAKLRVRKRGYRGQDLTVTLDRDAKKVVTLEKLGPDDIDDIDNCVQPK